MGMFDVWMCEMNMIIDLQNERDQINVYVFYLLLYIVYVFFLKLRFYVFYDCNICIYIFQNKFYLDINVKFFLNLYVLECGIVQ